MGMFMMMMTDCAHLLDRLQVEGPRTRPSGSQRDVVHVSSDVLRSL